MAFGELFDIVAHTRVAWRRAGTARRLLCWRCGCKFHGAAGRARPTERQETGRAHIGRDSFRGPLPIVVRATWLDRALAYGVAPLNFTTVAPCTGPICALSLTFSTTARRNSSVPCTTARGPMTISGGVVFQ